jgi:PhoPQ-activated pathogenicity-related protein
MPQAPTELYSYVSRRDSSFKWSVLEEKKDSLEMQVTSQTWQGRPWQHSLVITSPRKLQHKDTFLLVVTGDRRDSDIAEARLLAARSGMRVATLFDVPNQPIWDLREDALIAHTFVKFLQTGNASWPLIFPMTKSVVRAMDAIQAQTKAARFVVTGMSKRGWTTWMTGTLGDKRVVGLAPMIYDNLNIPTQLKHQMESWGRYSEMIEDYTSRGLQNTLDSENGKRLATVVDPYSYRSRITAPTLVITGSNDPYWPVDAHSLYWSGLTQPVWQLVLPNVGHGSGDGDLYVSGLSAFARSCAGDFKMPKLRWSVERTDEPGGAARSVSVQVQSEDPPASHLVVWQATSDTTDFRNSTWVESAKATVTSNPKVTISGTPKGRFAPVVRVIVPSNKNVAILLEQRFHFGDIEFSLTSPVTIFKR